MNSSILLEKHINEELRWQFLSTISRILCEIFDEFFLSFSIFICQVIMDVVFNHTAEGNENGPVISFRGVDNSVFYMLAPKV